MYQKSRNLLDCHIAGFIYYDGLDVIDELVLGAHVSLKLEEDNPYDPEAVAIYFKDSKLGYVPQGRCPELCSLLYYGEDLLEARICSRDSENHPERQFRIVVKFKKKSS